jgi:hypothetical protein
MNKSTAILLIILVLGGFIYFYVTGDNASTSSSLLGSGSTVASDNAAAEVLALLKQIQSLEIDAKIFEMPVYKTLQDYSVEVPPQNVGRPNPFAPIR